MASSELETLYASDWEAHDGVEGAEYESPPDIPPERLVPGLKVLLDDTVFGVVGGQVSFGEAVSNALAWTPTEPTLTLGIKGVLRCDSGVVVITAATKSRLGHWLLTVEPLREDANADA